MATAITKPTKMNTAKIPKNAIGGPSFGRAPKACGFENIVLNISPYATAPNEPRKARTA